MSDLLFSSKVAVGKLADNASICGTIGVAAPYLYLTHWYVRLPIAFGFRLTNELQVHPTCIRRLPHGPRSHQGYGALAHARLPRFSPDFRPREGPDTLLPPVSHPSSPLH